MRVATLVVDDEVNVKINGLDHRAGKLLQDKYNVELPHARHMPSVKLGRWDGKIKFCTQAGRTFQNLLPEILPLLIEQGYELELQDNRDYRCDFEFDEVNKDSYSHITWPKGHRYEYEKIVLYDYQVEIINKYFANQQSIQEIATGAGKTLITAILSHRCQDYGRTIVIVPSKSLVVQTEEDYINLGLDVGVYYGDKKQLDKRHTICTWQSLNNMLKDNKELLMTFFEDVVTVIVDEVHQAKAEVLKTILTSVGAKIPIRWGLTGTIPKPKYDQLVIRCSIGEVISKISAVELQEMGILARCHVTIVQMLESIEYPNYQSELKYLLSDPDRLDYMAERIERIRENGNTLVLVDRIAAAEGLHERIPDSVMVIGKTKVEDRKQEYDDVAITDNKVIIATYGVAAIGINIPRIFNMVLIEPGKSFIRVIQSIGRGIRKADDKDFVQIWDFTSGCKFSKRHLTQRKAYYREAEYPFNIEKVDWNG